MDYYLQVKHKSVAKSELSVTLEDLAWRAKRAEGTFTVKQMTLEDPAMLEKNAKNLIDMTDMGSEGGCITPREL